MSDNLYKQFFDGFSANIEKPFLVTDTEQSVDYSTVDAESARFAQALTALGAEQGDRITVQVEKSVEMLWLYLGCLRAGLVFHPLNTAYQTGELNYFVENAAPRVIICASDSLAQMAELGKKHGVDHVLSLDAEGSGSLIDYVKDYPAEFTTVDSEADDTAALLYSSGTTGVPKGIMLTHGNLATNARTLCEVWGFRNDDILLHALPIFHVHGLFVALGCVLLSGASMRWLESYKAKTVLENLPKCTVMMGVPTYYTRLLALDNFTAEDCLNIRLFVSGSAPLLSETFEQFESRTGHRILERYGMTETNMNSSNPLEGERRPGSVGLPLPGVQIRVVNGQGEVLGVNSVGAVQVKGKNVFKAYWQLPEKTAEDFTEDGFFDTGDQGRFDDDGYLFIVGREKDMVISGGLNIYPKEIELVIDDIDGVIESAVIGVPHDDFGEGLVGVVVGESSLEQAIIGTVRASLAAYKVPKKLVFVEELPRNAMGKVQKNVLREQNKMLLKKRG